MNDRFWRKADIGDILKLVEEWGGEK